MGNLLEKRRGGERIGPVARSRESGAPNIRAGGPRLPVPMGENPG